LLPYISVKPQHERHTDQGICQCKYPHARIPASSLSLPGARGSQGPRSPDPDPKIERVPNRHPRLSNQLLRSPPDPRQIPTPTCISLGSRFRVLWRCPQSADLARRRQDTEVQGGRQGLWCFPRRLRNTHCLHRRETQARARGMEFRRCCWCICYSADELCRSGN